MVDVYEEMNRILEGQSTVLYSDFDETRVNELGGSINDGTYFASEENEQLAREKSEMSRNDPQLWVMGHSYDRLRRTVNFDTVDCTFRDARYTRDSDDLKHSAGAPTLSANVVPIDNNGNLWLDLRAKGVSTYASELHTIGGAYDPRADWNSIDNAMRETCEELLGGKSEISDENLGHMGDPSPLGVLLEDRSGWIQVAYSMRLDASTRDIKKLSDDAEGRKFALNANDPSFISQYLQLNANGFVPTGLAGLVLWGNRTYESGWACETLMGIEKTLREGDQERPSSVLTPA